MTDDPALPAPAGSDVALVSLATALGAVLWDGWRGQLPLPPRVLLWPLLGLWAL